MHPQKTIFSLLLMLSSLSLMGQSQPDAIGRLLNRIGGQGTAQRFVTIVDPTLQTATGADVFVVGSRDGKPCIKGSSTLAVTTGINWYLNHVAHQQITWQQLRLDLSKAPLPLPAKEQRRECKAQLRYYLNYCTFSYSMAFWSWERWQQEIDWMALHGINMPLTLVGADVVWLRVLEAMGYTRSEANRFVAGPAYQAWFLMSNLEGWGGPNPGWWYERQEHLCQQILQRERELGMEPVLPGYAGMVPADYFERQGEAHRSDGQWNYFRRPAFLVPTDPRFKNMARLYYEKLSQVMGRSRYYSMDLFHEGGNTAGIDLPKAFSGVFEAMDAASPGSHWVVQGWEGNPRRECLENVPKGRLIVLDLFADGAPHWKTGFGGHSFVYCMLPNFGGRTGLHGRMDRMVADYQQAIAQFPATAVGIGAAPEGIETDPVLYDLIYELPWTTIDDTKTWLSSYTTARYGQPSTLADSAWNLLRQSVYNCTTGQQGCSEPLVCARPSLHPRKVSSWSTAKLYYNPGMVRQAAALLLAERSRFAKNRNYQYDVVNLVRQTLCDEAYRLLNQMDEAHSAGAALDYDALGKQVCGLIEDLDQLLSTHPAFMLGTWTGDARRAAAEARHANPMDEQWMEENARMLITTWGNEKPANAGGLHDYSNRCWAGLLRTFYLPRWQKFFDLMAQGKPLPTDKEWYDMERAWQTNASLSFGNKPQGNPVSAARHMFNKHFGAVK